MTASEGLPLLQDHTLSPRSAAAAKQAETRHRRQRRIAIVVALLAVVAVVAIASKSSRVQSLLPWQLGQDEGYAAVMADYRKTHLDFDGVVQVTENDQVVFTDVSGHAIEESAAPMDIDSVFGIGSNSKLFTAVALYQLQERGRVNLSTPVNEVLDQTDFAAFGFRNQSVWCPRVAGAAADSPCENITFVQLMHMGSGIGDSLNCDNVDAAHCYRTADNLLYYKGSLAPYVGMFINDPLVFKPDTNYSYSNPNYYLLSYLVEKIAGQPLEQYLAENIVKPIGLKDTFYDPYSGFKGLSTSKVVQEYVHYYVRANTSVERIGTGTCSPFINNGAISGSGGFQSSVPDMQRWFADLFGSRGTKSKVLTVDSIRMLIDRVNPVNPSYGQGIGVGARGQDGWPLVLSYCGGIKCTTTCNAMVFLDGRPDEHGLISVYSNHQHGTFVNRTVFDQWRPHEAMPTDQPEGVEQDAGGAGVLPTPLARVYRAKQNTTTPSN